MTFFDYFPASRVAREILIRSRTPCFDAALLRITCPRTSQFPQVNSHKRTGRVLAMDNFGDDANVYAVTVKLN
jgi:hypothetical protein